MSLTNFDPRRHSNNRQFVFLATHPDFVKVALVTSMYVSGIGNVSSFGTWS